MQLKCAQKGLAIVEFTLVAPIFLVLLFGICEFGLILYDKAIITNASREAARSGIAYRTPKLTTTQIQAVANNYCTSYLVTFHSGINPTVTVAQSSPPDFGTPLKVTVTYNYYNLVFGNLLSLLSGGAFPNPLLLSAETTMNNE